MRTLFERIRQAVYPKGVWVAFHHDFSGIALFDEELPARRYAAENAMEVQFIRYGFDVREEILRR